MSEASSLEERFGKCPYATAQKLISGKRAVLILHYLEGRADAVQRAAAQDAHA